MVNVTQGRANHCTGSSRVVLAACRFLRASASAFFHVPFFWGKYSVILGEPLLLCVLFFSRGTIKWYIQSLWV